jgi:hypothetical protein
VGFLHFFLAAVSGGQAVRDPLDTLVERFHQWGPHEFHRETGQDEEDNELSKQSCV